MNGEDADKHRDGAERHVEVRLQGGLHRVNGGRLGRGISRPGAGWWAVPLARAISPAIGPQRDAAHAGLPVGDGAHAARSHSLDERVHQLEIHSAHEVAMLVGERVERAVREAEFVGALFSRLEALSREGPLCGAHERIAVRPRSGRATSLFSQSATELAGRVREMPRRSASACPDRAGEQPREHLVPTWRYR